MLETPEYCEACGTKLIEKVVPLDHFDRITGEKKNTTIRVCPNREPARWWHAFTSSYVRHDKYFKSEDGSHWW